MPPNTTHILQPADVGVFKPLKVLWRNEIHNFQRENVYECVWRVHVAPLLQKVLSCKRNSIINSLVATGLCPFNPDRVDYSKIMNRSDNDVAPPSTSTLTNSVEQQYYEKVMLTIKDIVGDDVNIIDPIAVSNV